jgi:hypothetical protein
MEYWSNNPMSGELQHIGKDTMQNILLHELNPKMLEEKEKSKKISRDTMFNDFSKGFMGYLKFHEDYAKWLIKECENNEFNIIKALKFIVSIGNKPREMKINYGIDCLNIENEMLYVIPISFMEWNIRLKPNSEISKYLLNLLKQTDGGSRIREFSDDDNKYPNSIYTPSDYIKTYIEKWNDLITGKIKINDIKSDEKVG